MSDQTPFPPSDLDGFLNLCAGRWMSLRSRFDMQASEEDWHASERGEIEVVASVANAESRLDVNPAEGDQTTLLFQSDGCLSILSGGNEQRGCWQLLQDASLELQLNSGHGEEVLERIWFIKPNLRLRSTTFVGEHGQLRQGSFCSEIRRVSGPKG